MIEEKELLLDPSTKEVADRVIFFYAREGESSEVTFLPHKTMEEVEVYIRGKIADLVDFHDFADRIEDVDYEVENYSREFHEIYFS